MAKTKKKAVLYKVQYLSDRQIVWMTKEEMKKWGKAVVYLGETK